MKDLVEYFRSATSEGETFLGLTSDEHSVWYSTRAGGPYTLSTKDAAGEVYDRAKLMARKRSARAKRRATALVVPDGLVSSGVVLHGVANESHTSTAASAVPLGAASATDAAAPASTASPESEREQMQEERTDAGGGGESDEARIATDPFSSTAGAPAASWPSALAPSPPVIALNVTPAAELPSQPPTRTCDHVGAWHHWCAACQGHKLRLHHWNEMMLRKWREITPAAAPVAVPVTTPAAAPLAAPVAAPLAAPVLAPAPVSAAPAPMEGSGGSELPGARPAHNDRRLPVQRGAQGEPGAQGERGPPGECGPPGERGAQGECGLPGERGAQGERGLSGERGAQGERGQQGECDEARIVTRAVAAVMERLQPQISGIRAEFTEACAVDLLEVVNAGLQRKVAEQAEQISALLRDQEALQKMVLELHASSRSAF